MDIFIILSSKLDIFRIYSGFFQVKPLCDYCEDTLKKAQLYSAYFQPSLSEYMVKSCLKLFGLSSGYFQCIDFWKYLWYPQPSFNVSSIVNSLNLPWNDAWNYVTYFQYFFIERKVKYVIMHSTYSQWIYLPWFQGISSEIMVKKRLVFSYCICHRFNVKMVETGCKYGEQRCSIFNQISLY